MTVRPTRFPARVPFSASPSFRLDNHRPRHPIEDAARILARYV